MLAELSQGRSCGRVARGGRGTVCRVEFSYPVTAAVTTSLLLYTGDVTSRYSHSTLQVRVAVQLQSTLVILS